MEFCCLAYAESVPAVRISEDRVVVGEWSNELIELVETSAHIRQLLRAGNHVEARALMRSRRAEEQGALVVVDENPEEALSLTAMDERGRPGYLPAVVDHLPTETLSQLLAPSDARHMRFNTEILRVMSPHVLPSCRRNPGSHRFPCTPQPGVVGMAGGGHLAERVDRIAELLYWADESALEDAFLERIEHFDMHAVVCGISAFRLVSETSAGTMLNPIDDAETRQVTEAIHRAVPELLNKILRAAWERRT